MSDEGERGRRVYISLQNVSDVDYICSLLGQWHEWVGIRQAVIFTMRIL